MRRPPFEGVILLKQKLRVLLITGRVVKEHDYRRINELLRRMLESTGRFDVRITESFTGSTAKSLEEYDLVLLNYDGRNWLSEPEFVYWDDIAFQALYDFVGGGKGIVFYHSSFSLGPETPDEYLRMMGGGHDLTTGGRHNPKGDYTVHFSDEEHPITRSLKRDWFIVGDDMLPVITWHPKAKPHILATVFDSVEDYNVPGWPPQYMIHRLADGDPAKMPEINTDQPVAWTNEYDKGRVFVVTIGHDIDTLRRLNYLVMFVRGCEWAATGKVTLDVPDRTGDNRLIPWPYYNGEEQ